LSVSLAYPNGEEGGNFIVQMISSCLPSRRGGGGRHPVVCDDWTISSRFKTNLTWNAEQDIQNTVCVFTIGNTCYQCMTD
jgi:hypothetical protein